MRHRISGSTFVATEPPSLSMCAMFDGVLTLRAISVAMLDVRGVPNPGGVC